MPKKKNKRKALLGDNPFGDIAAIEVPAERRARAAAKTKKPAGAKKKSRGRRASSPEVMISEAERKIEEVLETMSTRETDQKDTLVDFASRMQTKMAAIQVEAGEEGRALQALLRLARPSFYIRKLAPVILAGRGVETDEFGRDETLESNLRPVIKCLFDRYFRIRVDGIENIPPSGGCIVVANHAPVLSLDGIMIRHAITSKVRPDARWLLENELFYMPYLGTLAQRIGAVRASQENATLLLDRGSLIITFPEGILGISRTFSERYSLKRFGRGGYVRLAVQHSVPVLPAAIVGPQNSFPILWKTSLGAKHISIPFIPITPTFPLLGPFGLIPLPLQWKVKFGAPVRFDYPGDARLDQTTINRLNNSVRDGILQMVDELRRE
jgi:1-acyl-sn-glycerol-3-phosphate acyltransferase